MSVKKNLQKKRVRVKRIRQDRARHSQLIDAQWNLDLAMDALRRRDYENANLHVQKALHLKPDRHHALRLKAMVALEIPKPSLTASLCPFSSVIRLCRFKSATSFSMDL